MIRILTVGIFARGMMFILCEEGSIFFGRMMRILVEDEGQLVMARYVSLDGMC